MLRRALEEVHPTYVGGLVLDWHTVCCDARTDFLRASVVVILPCPLSILLRHDVNLGATYAETLVS